MKTFCVVGHDARQRAAAQTLQAAGFRIIGPEAACQADFVLLPMSQERVSDAVARTLQGVRPGTLLLAGRPGSPIQAAAPLDRLPVLLAKHDTVINTIPAPVLPRKMLEKLPRGALVIDLASLPGGTDFDAAEALGIRAEHALALPGKCAPDTAGALIAQTVLTILQERGDLHDEPA